LPPASGDPAFNTAAGALAASGATIGLDMLERQLQGFKHTEPAPIHKTSARDTATLNGKTWSFSHNGVLDKARLKSLIGLRIFHSSPSPEHGC